MSQRLNWKAAEDRRRVRKQGAETVNGAPLFNSPAPARTEATSTRRKAQHLSEPIIIDCWWKNRAHDAVYIRLAPFKEHTLIDIRVWVTPADGITRPGKGFSCTVKHLPRLVDALTKALAKAREHGLLDTEKVER
jgi:Transcriptional Coactivator p15 (PC4)